MAEARGGRSILLEAMGLRANRLTYAARAALPHVEALILRPAMKRLEADLAACPPQDVEAAVVERMLPVAKLTILAAFRRAGEMEWMHGPEAAAQLEAELFNFFVKHPPLC